MKESSYWIRLFVMVGAVVALSGYIAAQQPVQLAGVP